MTEADPSSLRVLVVHEWLVTWAGSERCVERILGLYPQADFVVGVISDEMRDLNATTRRARETWLGRLPFARTRHRWFLPLFPLAFATIDTSGYDLVISSAHAFAKAVRPGRGAAHLCYCYSPPRYLWDLQEAYQRDAGMAGRLLGLAAPLLRLIDRLSARRVGHFVGISGYIAARIRRCYGREATVVYPPVSPKPVSHRPARRSDSLLVLGRLVPYKRVDLAIEAANRLGAPLIIAGDGPERSRLERLAGPTVTFLGEVSEVEAGDLLESCRAMVFCADEDFGISPLEANAHGMPVVAYARGAILETMVDGATAILFPELTVDAVATAIERALETPWDADRLRANAERFSPERFDAGIRAECASLLAERRGADASRVSSAIGNRGTIA